MKTFTRKKNTDKMHASMFSQQLHLKQKSKISKVLQFPTTDIFSPIFKQNKVYHWPKATKLCNAYAGSHRFYVMFYNAQHLKQIHYSAFFQLKHLNVDFKNRMPLLKPAVF